jgi:hypothetical protein
MERQERKSMILGFWEGLSIGITIVMAMIGTFFLGAWVGMEAERKYPRRKKEQ